MHLLTSKRKNTFSRQYKADCKSADALIRRYLRGRMRDMPNIWYPSRAPYLDLAPSDPPVNDFDAELMRCDALVKDWPLQVRTVMRLYWGDRLSIRQIAGRESLGRRRVANIVETVRYKVFSACIEAGRIRSTAL